MPLESDYGQNLSYALPWLFTDLGGIHGKDNDDSDDSMRRESVSRR